jgi:hypothetical protein
MNITQTIEKLHALKLTGMVAALEEQQQQNSITELSFHERFSLVVERQWLWKEDRALARRLQYAAFKIKSTMEEIDYRHPRNRSREILSGLCHRSPRLSAILSHPLLLRPKAVPGSGERTCGRQPDTPTGQIDESAAPPH